MTKNECCVNEKSILDYVDKSDFVLIAWHINVEFTYKSKVVIQNEGI